MNPEDYEPFDWDNQRVKNCPACGRFLTKEPNDKYHRFERNGHMTYDKNGEELWVEEAPTDLGFEPLWACSCGAKWTADDIYP